MKYNLTIRGAIGGYWGADLESVIDYLEQNKDKAIDVMICSPGGSVAAGLEVYQAFRDHGNVHAHIVGMTASIATVIAMGAKKVSMVKDSVMLIHNTSIGVLEWSQLNKEQLDALVAKLNKTRNDLATLDDLIASIYADKTKKPIDEVKALMGENKWIKATEAKAFGLVDDIREDEEGGKALNEIFSQFNNSIIKDFGLPAFPDRGDSDSPTATIVDKEGNPTEGFLQKTLHALRDLVRNDRALNNQHSTTMSKILPVLCAVLGFNDGIEAKDDYISLSLSDAQKINDKLDALTKESADFKAQVEQSQAKVADLQKALDKANADIAERDTQINQLKDSAPAPAANPGETKAEQPNAEQIGLAMFNSVKNSI